MDGPKQSRGFKPAAKRLAFWLASVLVVPSLVSFWLRSRVLGRDRALLGSSQLLSLVPGLWGQYLRRAFYHRALASCDPSVTIEFGALFSQAGTRLGRNVYVGPMSHIGLAELGDDVLVAAAVHIPSGPRVHRFERLDRPIREQRGEPRRVRIGAGSWIGSAAVVLADVGRETVVAAGSVVSKPLPDLVVAAGVPAEVIKSRLDRAAARQEVE